MHTPHSSQVLKVINNFKMVLPIAKTEDNLDFYECGLQKEKCGTVCCHGGWYSVASKIFRNKHTSDFYLDGAIKMAKDLGFRRWEELITWAEDNSEIWGNVNGVDMFTVVGSVSFISKSRPEGAQKLQHIIDHWTEVYERLLAIEQPTYPDITKQLAVLPQEERADQPIKTTICN